MKINKIGIISDTHDQVENILSAINYFNKNRVELVVHCGDWVSPFTLAFYNTLKAKIIGVFGNNDGDIFRLMEYSRRFGLDISFKNKLYTFENHGKKIIVTHGEYSEIVNAIKKSGIYDVILIGHTHRPLIQKENGNICINPGTLMDYTEPGTERASIALYDALTHNARIIYLDDLKYTNATN